MSRHDPTRRAEAAVPRWDSAAPRPDDLTQAKEGRLAGGGRWIPVEGPYLRTVRTRDRRNTTGVVGISLYRARRRPGGPLRTFFLASLGRASKKFCIETLGRNEAFRRAVAARAAHELKVRAANALIIQARNKHSHV